MRGSDKLLQDVDGMPLLRRQAVQALATRHPTYVALPALDHPRATILADLDVVLLAVPDWASGMSATLRDAVASLPPVAAFVVLLADLVAITTDDLNRVIAARHASPDHLIWRGATADGKPGHPILFDASLRPAFMSLTGDQGGAPVIKANLTKTRLVFLPDNRALLDLDTPEDWAAWRETQA